jgi:hypothetical protein
MPDARRGSGDQHPLAEVSRQLQEHSPRRGIRFNVLVTLIEVGGAIALFHLARNAGASNAAGYLVGSLAPLAGGALIWIRARRFSGASAAIFAFTGLSAVIAVVGSTSPKALLYKDCATTALIGLIFLGSCFTRRKPVAFYMAQRWGSDGTHEGMSIFDTIWDHSRDFRWGMYVISCLWAALFLLQSAATAWIISRTNYSTAYNYDQLLPVVVLAVGIAGSVAVGRVLRRRGRARAAGAST